MSFAGVGTALVLYLEQKAVDEANAVKRTRELEELASVNGCFANVVQEKEMHDEKRGCCLLAGVTLDQ